MPPPNSHLKRRLIQPLPLRVTLKKNNRRTVLHGRNQTAAKTIYFCTISLSPADWKPTRRSCLRLVFLQTFLSYKEKRELILNLTSHVCVFYLDRCILAVQTCISALAFPLVSFVFVFDCQYLKHYSMMLLCTSFVISPLH